MFDKSKAVSQLKVDGKMTQNGADKVGKLQAVAWIILAIGIAIGIILFALSFTNVFTNTRIKNAPHTTNPTNR